MRLELYRQEFYDDRTIGSLYINGKWFCYTLEDTDRRLEEGGQKIPGKTAIPRGEYKVTISYSNRFKRMMPHVLDVPQFQGIRIHAGNTPADTEGCPLIGYEYDVKTHNVLRSRDCYNDFFEHLKKGLLEGDVFMRIS